MIRRPLVATLVALAAVVAVVLGACSPAPPQASPVSDPKLILTNTLTSLKDVKTLEFSGSFSGSAKVPQLGEIDLSTMKLAGQADLPNKKAKVTLDAPSLFGTKVDAILIDTTAYYKIAGPLALAVNASADTWTKVEIPQSSGNPADVATDPAKAAQELQAQLDKLPTPPVKQADEKCGDQDCYHVTIHASAADLKTLDPTSSINGDVTLDVWSRKSDFRPARIGASVATVDMGTFGVSIDIRYDVSVSIDAPPADQVVTPSQLVAPSQ